VFFVVSLVNLKLILFESERKAGRPDNPVKKKGRAVYSGDGDGARAKCLA